MDNFDPYNVLLAIATNIAVWIKTGFVVEGHKYSIQLENVKKNVKYSFIHNVLIFIFVLCFCKLNFVKILFWSVCYL